MKTVCKKNMCTGCMTCLAVCQHSAITVNDDIKSYNAIIDPEACIDCGRCHKTCPQNTLPAMRDPIEWKQGWAKEEIRKESASGGAAAALSKAFIKNGGYVVSCVFQNGEFTFDIARTEEEAKKFRGSKYVKSNPSKVLSIVEEELKKGEQILFIGLPCQVAGLIKYIPTSLAGNLYTVDLICHGTPSPKLFEGVLKEYGMDISEISDINFRENNTFCTLVNGKRLDPKGYQDEYILGFLDGLFYTDNCYECNFAQLKRCSDLTIGDSWGTDLPKEEMRKGISLILAQTEKGKTLMEEMEFDVSAVDLDRAVQANHQLQHPTPKTEKREKFFAQLEEGRSVRSTFRGLNKKIYLKQAIKKIIRRPAMKSQA